MVEAQCGERQGDSLWSYKELELTSKGVEVAKLLVEVEKVLRKQDWICGGQARHFL